MRLILLALTLAVVPGSYLLLAQAPAAGGQGGRGPGRRRCRSSSPASLRATAPTTAASPEPTRIVSSSGAAAGRGAPVTWHAYLSTQGAGAVNARDRIGNGPWYNANGAVVAMNVGQLHGDTIEQARIGNALGKQFSLTEKKERVNGVGDMPNRTTS